MRLPVVEVDWVDAITRIESCPLSEIAASTSAELRHRHTVGYLVHQDKKRVVLASDFDEPEDGETQPTVGTFTVLPAGWVTKVTTVREGEAPPPVEGVVA